MLPNFIIAGAAKSGTTAMQEVLSAHPDVCMSWMKGPTYFTREAPRASYHKGRSWYESLFHVCDGARAIGEVSPFYMICTDAPYLIYQTIPDVRLLFVLRDPVERIYSYYRYTLQRGFQLPDLERMAAEGHPELKQAIYVSSYHLHINRYLQVFPKEQVSIFIYEDWLSDARAFLCSVYQSIGVDADFVPDNLSQRYNPSQQARVVWLQHMLNTLGERIIRLDLPPTLFNLLKAARGSLWKINSKGVQFPPLSPQLRNDLYSNFTETVDYIEEYLDRPLTAWRLANNDVEKA